MENEHTKVYFSTYIINRNKEIYVPQGRLGGPKKVIKDRNQNKTNLYCTDPHLKSPK